MSARANLMSKVLSLTRACYGEYVDEVAWVAPCDVVIWVEYLRAGLTRRQMPRALRVTRGSVYLSLTTKMDRRKAYPSSRVWGSLFGPMAAYTQTYTINVMSVASVTINECGFGHFLMSCGFGHY